MKSWSPFCRFHVAPEFSDRSIPPSEPAGRLPPKADCEPQRHVREFRLDKSGGVGTKAACRPAEAEGTVERTKATREGVAEKSEAYHEHLQLQVGRGRPVAAASLGNVDLAAGVHKIDFQVDVSARKAAALRCELVEMPSSSARVQWAATR